MKVLINAFVLADYGADSVGNFRINGKRLTQVSQALRAPAARCFDRGNGLTVVTFEVSRLHDSTQEAELFVLTHDLLVPASGTAQFVARSESGREASRALRNAVVEVTESAYTGCTTRHSYIIKGGAASG